MELKHSFTVPAPIEATWTAFTDLEMVGGCFPGAAVTSVEGDDFTGTCKVKLGPISLLYAGSGSFLERDEETHKFVIEAKGKDKRGNGTAGATVTAVLTAVDPETTTADVTTDLSITGKPAQFGRGVIQDVSDKLLNEFVACLESKLAPAPEEAPPAAAPAEAPAAAPTEAAPAPSEAARPAEERPEVEALDLGATVLPILLKTYWKQMAAGFVVFYILWRVLRRRR
jgi:carbon monoxide dehydrogenase subunit G